MCRDHFSKSGPGGKNKICLSKIRSVWEKLRLFKVQLNPLASNSRATLARFVRTLQAHISAPSDPILLRHILFFASGSDLKESSLSFFTEKFSSTWKVTSTETDILSNFLQRVSQAVSFIAQPGQPSTLTWENAALLDGCDEIFLSPRNWETDLRWASDTSRWVVELNLSFWEHVRKYGSLYTATLNSQLSCPLSYVGFSRLF
jgi:hypothetical protein